MSNPLYSTCQQSQNGVPCLNEGLYFCNLCKRRWCEDHACVHLSVDLSKADETAPDNTTDGVFTGAFRATSEAVLKDMPLMYLKSYHTGLFEELKRVQRELERRSDYSKTYIPERREFIPVERHPKQAKSEAGAKRAETAKTKKLDALSAALDKLLAANMTPERLAQLLEKGKK